MIVALLILIALILLFAFARLKGWLRGSLGCGFALVCLLVAAGFAVSQYDDWHRAQAHARRVAEVRPIILQAVAVKSGRPVGDLIDIETYDQQSDVYLCGSIAGTFGYDGPNGRQRFLSDGGNTELERKNAGKKFDERRALRCTLEPDRAVWK